MLTLAPEAPTAAAAAAAPPAAPASPSLLQRALCDSALLQAWERVRLNDGCAGHDHQSIARFNRDLPGQLQQLQQELANGLYQPKPLQAVHVPKAKGGSRLLAIPAVRDRLLQTAVAQALVPGLDPQFADCSFAYRPGRSVAMAIGRVVQHRDQGLRSVVDADIEAFFDHIDHPLLLAALRRKLAGDTSLLPLIELWLAADLRDPQAPAPRLLERGVPQGSPLSPLLANLYLDPLDHQLQGEGLALVRYADDLVILCPDEPAARAALARLREMLADLRLRPNEGKTRLASFDTGFTFLGVRFVHRLVEPMLPAAAPWLLPGGSGPPAAEPPPATAGGRALNSLDPGLDDPSQPDDPAQAATEQRPPLLQTLYVGEPGALLSKDHDRVIVSVKREVRASVPLGQIDQIAVMDNALISTALLRACAQRRIAVAFGGPGGELVALQRGALPDQAIVARQWQAQALPDLHLLFARQFIDGKLHNCRTVLRRFSRRDGRDAVHPHLLGIDDCHHRLASAPNLPTLRGLEGAGARHYFAALRCLLPEGVVFPGRNRRPPRDPVNALLSLAYAVLAHNLHTLLLLAGLNPHLGHLHAAAPASLALVSDLTEEFRAPVADAVVLTLLRQRAITAADFVIDDDAEQPCRLTSAARRRFIAALEAKLDSVFIHPRLQLGMDYRRAMQAQVEHYGRVLAREELVYQPLKLR